MVTIRPPARLVGEPKKTKKRKEGRKERRKTPKQWQTGYSHRPPMSSDQNETLRGRWPAVCSYTCQVWSKSVKGLRRCGGSKMALSYYFGQWLIQQLVLPYVQAVIEKLLSITWTWSSAYADKLARRAVRYIVFGSVGYLCYIFCSYRKALHAEQWALLLDVQRVTSPRIPRLRRLICSVFHILPSKRIQIVSLKYSRLLV